MKKICLLILILASCSSAPASNDERDANCKCTPDCNTKDQHCGCRAQCGCRN